MKKIESRIFLGALGRWAMTQGLTRVPSGPAGRRRIGAERAGGLPGPWPHLTPV